MLKIDYNVINNDLWIKQNKENIEIHAGDKFINVKHEDIPDLIQGLRSYYDVNSLIQLKYLTDEIFI